LLRPGKQPLFGGIATLYLIPRILFYLQTKGPTYEELDELFELRIPAWKFTTTMTAYQAEVQGQNVGAVRD
jgi:hypothetical protein